MLLCALVACGEVRGQAVRPAQAAGGKRPNIVFIISDDHRWDMVGIAGNEKVDTPNLDRMGREGVYFRQGTVVVPQCSPNRAAMLTGRVPHQTGWLSNQYQEERANGKEGLKGPFLPAVLQAAGYHTALVGKWHLQVEPWETGFGEVRTWMPGGSGKYKDVPLARGNSRERAVREGFTNLVFADDAVAFMKERKEKADGPFFLWLALTAPHAPYRPNPDEITRRYEGKTRKELLPPGFPPGTANPGNFPAYYEAVTVADRAAGRVLDAVDALGLADDTVVVFMGDNGYMMGSRGVGEKGAAGKVVPYEESVRVPFIVKAPKGLATPGRVSAAAVSSIDLPVMFARLAGAEPPAEWAGRDMRPALVEEKPAGFDEAFVEWADTKSEEFGDLAYRQVRTPAHKLIVWEKAGKGPELYDLAKDPHEGKNVYGEAGYADVRQRLEGRLKAWRERTADPSLEGKK
jgi:N-acetylglucosamine-6-sulfatase